MKMTLNNNEIEKIITKYFQQQGLNVEDIEVYVENCTSHCYIAFGDDTDEVCI